GAGAKNDPDAVAHDYMARVYNTQLLRAKYPHRGDKFGNEYSVMQFKRTGIDMLNGVVTETSVPVLDENGKQVLDKDGKPARRQKTPMEVFSELSEFQTVAVARTRDLQRQLEAITDKNSQAYKDKKQEVQDHIDLSNQKYVNLAQQVTFGQRTLSNYYEDHLKNSVDLYKQLVSGEEIEFEKFTSYDVFGGVRFKGQEFQKAVQDQWIHKIRYMIDTYPSLNFNQTVRVMDQTETNHRHWRKGKDGKTHPGEPAFHEVKLGEAMFGHEMLNRPLFWKRDKLGRAIPIKDQNGKRIKGSYEIDYQKVQDHKQDVWKQWFLMKIAGDLYSHRALHANEPRLNFTYYQKVLESIGRIPKDILQNEFDFKKSHTSEYFFNESDMAWLKNKARVETFDLYYKAILKDLFIDDKPEEGIGLVLALSLAMKAIVANKI
ncbi:MAG TPA: hypothetical protein VLG67_04440, partial [Candidatus Saccharimonadales bacterium]|nr:hypothetical protein [Candidatus Saccharimonadales bacterium]